MSAPIPPGALPVTFHGRARDYFGIWITNLLLTLVTIGLWSAWAKVRRLRYFYGNTEAAGGSLDYTARPWSILLGRVLVVGILGLVALVETASPFASVPVGLASLALLPWLVNRSLRFNARMTLWQAVRFDFRGTYGAAAKVHLGWPLASAVSLGILLPFATRASGRYWVNHRFLGTARFASLPPMGPFYAALLQAGLVMGLAFATCGAAGAAVFMGLGGEFQEAEELGAALTVSFLPAFLLARVFYRTRARAILLNHLTLEEGHRFVCRLSALRYTWIVATNAVATLLTLGFAHPWTAVRAWRYQCSCLWILPAGAIDTFISKQREAGSAFASEFADLEGFDIGV
ncbi:YjgN family protein [Pararhodospirillum photometricum]|uniref:DUF898 domain-containing protein n=1 Tax=Pararhodospirillum photometricum DSM 122 TaxID=1150469 RepID=H6SRP9_PARPM|nr:YjgN family protein [Pararhodospirillum photometricum]CCG07578.1 Putative uncharacterized protein [Pararhodospirillum photometricum DSM 122]